MSEFVSGAFQVTVGAVVVGAVAAATAFADFLTETSRMAAADSTNLLATDSVSLGELATVHADCGSLALLRDNAPSLAALTEAYSTNASAASTIELPTLVHDAVERLRTDERETAVKVLSQSMEARGYEVETSVSDARASRITAKNGSEVIIAEFARKGALDIDTYGFDGAECERAVDTLIEEAHRRGVTLSGLQRRSNGGKPTIGRVKAKPSRERRRPALRHKGRT